MKYTISHESGFDYLEDTPTPGARVRFMPEDFVNPDELDPHSPKQKAWVVLNYGTVLAIVFGANCEQDALDEAADSGKLDGMLIPAEDLKDYETGERTDVGSEHCPEGYPVEDERVIRLGNASEPFDCSYLDLWCVPASLFAEEPCLMTFDRVMERLDQAVNRAKKAYCDVKDPEDPAWSQTYREREDARDAAKLAFLIGSTRSKFSV